MSSNFLINEDQENPSGLLVEQEDQPPFFKLPMPKIWESIKEIIDASFTTILSLIYTYAANLVSLAFLGYLKDSAMIGGAGLGFVCSNCCAYILITSINQGVNVLAAQAFGANKPSIVALNYHRGLFILMVFLIPIFVLLGFSKPILMFFGIDSSLAQYAWEYILYAYPSFLFYGLFDCTKSYLYAQNIFKPILYIQTITTALHFLWAWLFIIKLNLGPAGAGIAKSIYEFSNMMILFIYIFASRCCGENWVPLSKIEWRHRVLNWTGIKVFITTVAPIAALLFLDMACYEIFTMLAGQFGQDQLAAHVAIANTVTLYFSIPFGISITVMTFVSNSMGNILPNKAKNSTYSGVILNLLISAAFVITLFICRESWASLFSSNVEMKNLLLNLLKLYFIFVFIDGVQVVLSGTLKGIGKQNAATVGLLISYYLVAIPLIYVLAFKLNLQVMGIWIGFLSGIALLFVIYLLVLAKTNFRKQAIEIQTNFDD